MKQILCIALLCVSFNFANAVIIRTNCPDFSTTNNCIGKYENSLRINLIIEGPKIPGDLDDYTVDFTSNLGDYDNIPVSDFGIPLNDLDKRIYNINIPLFLNYNYSNKRFSFDAILKKPNGVVAAVAGSMNTSICEYLDNNWNPRLSNDTSAEIIPIKSTDKVKVTPNPFIKNFTVEYPVNKSQITKVEIFNLNGNLLHTDIQKNNSIGMFKKNIDVKLPKGIYICRLSSADFEKNIRLIKM